MMKSKTMVFAAFMLICLSIMNPLCGGQRVFAEEKKDYLKIGFRLMREEALGNLAVGISDSAVNQQMGEAEKKSEPKVWAADGYVHQSWYYPAKGIELDMNNRPEGKPVVGRLTITAPCDLKTRRGIGIGSTVQDVKTAYANELNPNFSPESSSLLAGTVYGGILFSLQDGAVSRIFIGAAAE